MFLMRVSSGLFDDKGVAWWILAFSWFLSAGKHGGGVRYPQIFEFGEHALYSIE